MTEAGEQQDSKHRDDVRAAVRDALLGLLHDKAFKDVTIDEIARSAGLTRTAFYFYFKNKTEVLVAVLEGVNSDLYAEADRWYSGDGPPEQLVREAIEGVARVYGDNADIMRTAVEIAGYDAEFRDFYRGLTERFVTAAAGHIRSEQAAGRARQFDAEQVAESLVWMVERSNYMFLTVDNRPRAEVVEALTAAWTHAVYLDQALTDT